ncbi:MAG: ATP-binding cassette domain-containing protein [Deltaproteobacteria bacterium]|nr:ATP-binding cassette domain-containing protein [Deltaproteobacteria bacterium]
MSQASNTAINTPALATEKSGEVLLSLKGVSKKFCKNLKLNMLYGLADLCKGLVGSKPNTTKLRKEEFWAVDDINLEIRRGQVLGVIGENGSGKSTLLRLIAGIFPIDKGEVSTKGRFAALISLGAGFHPHLTGRENIYLNGTILGMSRKEIDSKADSIIKFAGIDDFIDSPVSTYSSGMKVKLGFSIAIAIKPDILILDEVLAVGDRGFRAKCFNEIDQLSKNTAIIFVSHHMQKITRVCTDVLVMDKGKMVYLTDNVSEGLDFYFAQKEIDTPSMQREGSSNINKITLSSIKSSHTDDGTLTIDHLDPLTVELNVTLDRSVETATLFILFTDNEFNLVSESSSEISGFKLINKAPYEYNIRIHFDHIPFYPGKYGISIILKDCDKKGPLIKYLTAKSFIVKGEHTSNAPVHLSADWEC